MKNNTISLQTRNLRSLFLLLGLIFVYLNPANGQNCYVRLSDVSGITPTQAQLDSLESTACRLRDSLPSEFQSAFKVYDFGFYLHNETMVGGYPEAFQKAIDLAQAGSPYYLLFGKQTDKNGVYTRFWVDLKLPDTGSFECLTPSKKSVIKETVRLKTEGSYVELGSKSIHYGEAEIAGMNYLKTIFNSILSGNCCLITRSEIDGILLSKGFDKVPARFAEIPVSAKPGPNQQRMTGLVSNYANLLCEVQGIDGFEDFEYAIGNDIANAVNAGINAKGYITKNQNFCEAVGAQIINGFGDEAYIHLHFSPNPDSLKPGSLYTKIKTKELIPEITLPTVVISGVGNCNAPYPLPEPVVINNTYQWPAFNYAITKNQGKYYGYHSVNGVWQQGDSVEYYDRNAFNTSINEHTWDDKGARREFQVGMFYKYYPSYAAWRKSEPKDARKDFPTYILLDNVSLVFLLGSTFLDERERILQQFVFPNLNPILNYNPNIGTSLNWDCQSTVSVGLHEFSAVKNGLEQFKAVIKNWLKNHDDLDGLFIYRSNFESPITKNINLSSFFNLWAFQAFGGTQGRRIQVKKLEKIESPCAEGGMVGTKSFEIELIYTIYDNFGNGQDDAAKWWFPGLVELWVLQHYRNFNCDKAPCFVPITNHSVEIVDKSIICITN